ncbi:DUF11 domain-containing protein [Gracilimonas mengyeensis]|uniref:Conserved repeat domain-containing protein n=1 Tax=Gracilimonas mengyeensis TaxID=1302730 RepID=A0A521FKT8_9BACT|nr:DUF11 domain-containing protein [Gracilimonas mengyeensis]SMO96230.1 conserved repeat domain-containing protein [Gracilimonas mengyeensis]
MIRIVLFLVALLCAVPQLGFSQDGVSSELNAFLITTNQNGAEVSTEVTEVSPGDLIEYRLTYQNNLPSGITQLTPVLPVPSGTEYQEGTASPELYRASISNQGDDFQSLPLMREVTLPSGEVESQEVPAEEYRRLQWVVSSLDAGESVTLSARVRVLEND